MTTVDYWFDPVCPWSWVTSRWIHQVAGPADLDIHWHPMSLGVLNETADDDERTRNYVEILKGPVRVCAAVNETDPAALGALYTAIGENLHGQAGPLASNQMAGDDLVTGILRSRDAMFGATRSGIATAGLDDRFADAFDDAAVDDLVRASHARVPSGGQAQALIGVPTISVEGSSGLFGPVLTEVPTGERALGLWRAFAALAQEPAFYELKRTADRPAPRP